MLGVFAHCGPVTGTSRRSQARMNSAIHPVAVHMAAGLLADNGGWLTLWGNYGSGKSLVLTGLVMAYFLGPRNDFGPDQPTARQAPPASAAQLDELLDQLQACRTRGHGINIKVGEGQVRRQGSLLAWSGSASVE